MKEIIVMINDEIKEYIKEYIKENLTINVNINKEIDWDGYKTLELDVELLLDYEVISQITTSTPL